MKTFKINDVKRMDIIAILIFPHKTQKRLCIYKCERTENFVTNCTLRKEDRRFNFVPSIETKIFHNLEHFFTPLFP